jgi:hypothetical protein
MTEAAQAIFHRTCARCHGPDGRGITGVSPDIRRGSRRTSPEWFQFLRDGAHDLALEDGLVRRPQRRRGREIAAIWPTCPRSIAANDQESSSNTARSLSRLLTARGRLASRGGCC